MSCFKKEETIAAIISVVLFMALMSISIIDLISPTDNVPQRSTKMVDPSRDFMSTGENIHISMPNDPFADEYWEVESSLGRHYKVRREDYDDELGGYLDNEEEMLIDMHNQCTVNNCNSK